MRYAAVSSRPVDRSQSSHRDGSATAVSSRAGQPHKQSRKRKTSAKSRSSSSSSSSSDSSSSSSDSSDDERKRKKRRKREKREKKRLKKKEKKRLKRERKQKKLSTAMQDTGGGGGGTEEIGPVVPERGVGQAMRPMTKEEWEKQSSQLRYVVDTDTGRKRLIRGSGEIVEEMVSARRHQQINKQATRTDGENFQKTVNKVVAK